MLANSGGQFGSFNWDTCWSMKIEYLKEEYDAGKTEEEISKRFDTFMFKQQLKESMWGGQGGKDQFTL